MGTIIFMLYVFIITLIFYGIYYLSRYSCSKINCRTLYLQYKN